MNLPPVVWRSVDVPVYRGRIAPSPTGLLHLGHARTFWTAMQRAKRHGGVLIFRNEDIDVARCKEKYVQSMFEDLRWFGLAWSEGPDVGGPHAPYTQSRRHDRVLAAWNSLREGGWIYPCACSRKDIIAALSAPHEGDEEPVYPGTCRPVPGAVSEAETPGGVHWRFRVPEGEVIEFEDRFRGMVRFTAGIDFGDFAVWRRDGIPSYHLAVVVDDADMGITEVVRGEDLLLSTARQILLYRALGREAPGFYHCPLLRDANGQRLAKRNASVSLSHLRLSGADPEELRLRISESDVLESA